MRLETGARGCRLNVSLKMRYSETLAATHWTKKQKVSLDFGGRRGTTSLFSSISMSTIQEGDGENGKAAYLGISVTSNAVEAISPGIGNGDVSSEDGDIESLPISPAPPTTEVKQGSSTSVTASQSALCSPPAGPGACQRQTDRGTATTLLNGENVNENASNLAPSRIPYATVSYELIDTPAWNERKATLEESQCGGGFNLSGQNDIQLRNATYISRFAVVGIGTVVAAVGFFIIWSSEKMLDTRITFAVGSEEYHEALVEDLSSGYARWVIPSLISAFLAFIPVAFRPVAAGSGIAEAKAVLNGINIPHCTDVLTATCKAVSVIFSNAASLPCGLEGPMIFMGLSIGENANYLIPHKYPQLRTWRERRDLAAVGTAAGVSTAFLAPVGAVLFAAEEGASYLSTRLMWRCFSSGCVAVIMYFFIMSCENNSWWHSDGKAAYDIGRFDGLLPGQFESPIVTTFRFQEYLNFALMGVVGGILGACFIEVNKYLAKLRHKYVTNRGLKAAEVIVLTFISSTLFWCLPVLPAVSSCLSFQDVKADKHYFQRFNCEEGKYNDLATLLLNPPSSVAMNLLFWEDKGAFSAVACWTAGTLYLLLLVCIFGASIGMGIFIPLLYAGACFGRAYATHFVTMNVHTYAIVGSVAMLAGVVRVLVSITAIMMQTSAVPYLVTPFMTVTIISKVVGKWMFGGDGIYDEIIELKDLPFLEEEPPHITRSTVLKAVDIMSPPPLVLLEPLMKVSDAIGILKSTTRNHHDYPVVDPSRNSALTGTIRRERLMAILCHKDAFMSGPLPSEGQSESSVNSTQLSFDDLVNYDHHAPTIEEVEENLSDEDMNMYVSIARFVQLSPCVVEEGGSAERAYELFRTMGLRHLIVVADSFKPVGVITRFDLKRLEHTDKDDIKRRTFTDDRMSSSLGTASHSSSVYSVS